MNILEAQKWAVGKDLSGNIGLITASEKRHTLIGSFWEGLCFDDDHKLTDITWGVDFPEILFYLTEDIIYSGYQDSINKSNVENYVKFYFLVESFKEKFKEENDVKLTSVFSLFMHSNHDITYDSFCEEVKSKLIERYGTHSSHCCSDHGCKYGNKDCPVTLGLIEQEYPCEDCGDDDDELKHYSSEYLSYGDNKIMYELKNDQMFLMKLKEMKKRGIDLKDLI